MEMQTEQARESNPKKIAIVTYNRVGDGRYLNGVMRRNGLELYFAQNGHLAKRAARDCFDTYQRSRVAQSVAREFDLSQMDHSYIYVGAEGGEEAIRQTRHLHPDKVTYVMCDCNFSAKRALISNHGNTGARIMSCECGGRDTLAGIVEKLLA